MKRGEKRASHMTPFNYSRTFQLFDPSCRTTGFLVAAIHLHDAAGDDAAYRNRSKNGSFMG